MKYENGKHIYTANKVIYRFTTEYELRYTYHYW